MFLCSFDHFKRDMILEISQQSACVYLCSVEQFKPMLFKLNDQKNKSSQQCQSVEEVLEAGGHSLSQRHPQVGELYSLRCSPFSKMGQQMLDREEKMDRAEEE